MKKHVIIIFAILLLISSGASCETILSSLEDIAFYAAEHNPDYKTSQVNIMRADDNRIGLFLFNNSSLSVNTDIHDNLQGSESGLPGYKDPGYSAALTLPVIEQLSLSAAINNDLNGQLGINLKPLAHSSVQKELELKYNSSVISAEGTFISVKIGAVGAALKWMSAKRDLSAADRESELSEIRYKDNKVRYDLGEMTLDELTNSLITWSEARVLFSSKEQQYNASENLLYSTLGGGSGEVVVKMMELETLKDALARLKQSLDPDNSNQMKQSLYRLTVLNSQIAGVNLDNTWNFEPGLSASAGLVVDSTGNLSVEAGILFSISPSDFQKKKRTIAKKEYQISLLEAEQSLNLAQLNLEQTKDSIKSTAINSDISQLKMEQAEVLLSEADLLYKNGEYSELDLNESQLTLDKAKNSLFLSLINEYLSWLELEKYM